MTAPSKTPLVDAKYAEIYPGPPTVFTSAEDRWVHFARDLEMRLSDVTRERDAAQDRARHAEWAGAAIAEQELRAAREMYARESSAERVYAIQLQGALEDLAGRLEYFEAEGCRPDEWLLREWAQKARAALAKNPGVGAVASCARGDAKDGGSVTRHPTSGPVGLGPGRPFKIGDRVRSQLDPPYMPTATITEITLSGFKYRLDQPFSLGARYGWYQEGETYCPNHYYLVDDARIELSQEPTK